MIFRVGHAIGSSPYSAVDGEDPLTPGLDMGLNTFLMGVEHGNSEQRPGEPLDDATYQVARLAFKAGAGAAVDFMLRQGHLLPGEYASSREPSPPRPVVSKGVSNGSPKPQPRKRTVITVEEALELESFFPVSGKERWFTINSNVTGEGPARGIWFSDPLDMHLPSRGKGVSHNNSDTLQVAFERWTPRHRGVLCPLFGVGGCETGYSLKALPPG
jgi:hypothetical protein